jgi:hypothetical protein
VIGNLAAGHFFSQFFCFLLLLPTAVLFIHSSTRLSSYGAVLGGINAELVKACPLSKAYPQPHNFKTRYHPGDK